MANWLVLNFKNFKESTGKNAVKLAKFADEFASTSSKFEVVVAPAFTDLAVVSKAVSHCEVYAQHVDICHNGQCTGGFPLATARLYCAGTLLNHAERKLALETLRYSAEQCRENSLKVIACADSIDEAKKITKMQPTGIAIESPELIGTGISVSTANPELISNSVKLLKKLSPSSAVLVGAGVSNSVDVKKALDLGANGVLVASAFAKSTNPEQWLLSLLD